MTEHDQSPAADAMKCQWRPKVLFLLQVPPPVHGSSTMGLIVKESAVIRDQVDGRFFNTMTAVGMGETGWQYLAKFIRYLRLVIRVSRSLMFSRFNFCYFAITVSGPAFYKDAAIALLVRVFRVPLIFHLHNKGAAAASPGGFRDRLFTMVFRKSRVILLSDRLYPDVARYVPRARVDLCPNGVADSGRAAEGKTDNPVVELLFLSNMVKDKGGHVLLEACRILRESGQSFRCRFVGGSGDVDELDFSRRISEYRLEDVVSRVPGAYGDAKRDVFESADIFVFPSRNETFGLVAVEAMIHGLPVVSTFEGGIPDVVEDGETGLLCAKDNAAELASALGRLIADPAERRRMGEAGRRRYEEHFTVEQFEKRLAGILVAAASEHTIDALAGDKRRACVKA